MLVNRCKPLKKTNNLIKKALSMGLLLLLYHACEGYDVRDLLVELGLINFY
ncbi:Uncharacterised protein [Yersinia aleksiciae]|uniref:Uncharacterized protein n=1 Tax=Yersinia aleksiciae TaxID=263819 RepID=A0A0T9V1P1_YERAE|nr:Uncharacterised protein [Yersinia aleksiciae]